MLAISLPASFTATKWTVTTSPSLAAAPLPCWTSTTVWGKPCQPKTAVATQNAKAIKLTRRFGRAERGIGREWGKKMGKVTVVGSANIDFVFRSERFPGPGETVHGTGWSIFPGGKGANQAVAAAKIGGSVRFVAKMGDDPYSRAIRRSFEEVGLPTDSILVDPSLETGAASILVDGHAQNMIVVAAGANGALSPSEAIEAAGGFRDCRVALFQHETPAETVLACIHTASQHATVVLNPAPARPITDEVLSHVDVLTPNEFEAEVLTGVRPEDEESCRECAALLLQKGVRAVAITLGKQGCWVQTSSLARRVPSIEVKPVDTTAAGDAFNGALCVFLAEGRPLDESVALANRVGALSTTRQGAQTSLPTRDELGAVSGGLL